MAKKNQYMSILIDCGVQMNLEAARSVSAEAPGIGSSVATRRTYWWGDELRVNKWDEALNTIIDYNNSLLKR